MSRETLIASIKAVVGDKFVSAAEVIALRQTVFADGIVSRDEIAALVNLAARAPEGDREWRQFFVEALSDFFLNEEEPRGYLTDEEFAFIEGLVARENLEASALEIEALVALMERARSTPEAMSAFVADEFRRQLALAGKAAKVTAEDADLVRRFLYASGGAGSTGVTREEAELLFDIHDATAAAENDPSWHDLFIKGVAAHLMMHVGYKPLPRAEALRLHDWVKDQSVNPGGFFNRMFSGGLAGVRDAYGRKSVRSLRNEEDEIARAIAEQVTALEADWLADRIGRNGRLDEAEQALVRYMKDLDADLPPKLQALVDKAA